eukprot:TRINITY_DN10664_c0_g1_i2.p1 TRINITY_DN10664_c0_g1~~TRINITY_DN10664_c0_g1_i2.p1  ORF type:complete len:108 (+),score=5.32 TRINITY_DN10664_c0_g1_i2:224-547(+)
MFFMRLLISAGSVGAVGLFDFEFVTVVFIGFEIVCFLVILTLFDLSVPSFDANCETRALLNSRVLDGLGDLGVVGDCLGVSVFKPTTSGSEISEVSATTAGPVLCVD